jgi:isocitrate/isopropylmalate dehydrogenase
VLKIGVLLGDNIGLEVVPECAKHLTADLGGKASTKQMGDAVAAAV